MNFRRSVSLLLALGLLLAEGEVRAQKAQNNALFLPAEIPAGTGLPADMMQRVHRPVRINKALLDSAEPGQLVTFHLFTDTPLTLRLETREAHLPGTYSWIGRLTGELDSLFILSVVKDAASLSLNLGGDRVIGLQYLRDGVHLLNVSEPLRNFRCGTGPTTTRLPSPEPGSGIRIQAVSYIDTSICVSNQAVAEAGGFNAAVSKAVNCVAVANASCNNSNAQTQFLLYGVYQIAFDESGSAGQILARFEGNATANDIMNRGKLDMVGLLISNFPAGDAAGVARTPHRYSVTQIDSYTERTYAHEVGHCVGNGHEPGDQFPSNPDWDRGIYHYSSGHSWVHLSQYFVTIMSYGRAWDPNWMLVMNFIANYSNPSVEYRDWLGIGGATGTANDRDNARSMREYAGTVAAYASVGAEVYVDGGYTGSSNGSELYPYKTVLEGMIIVSNGGNVWIKGPRNYNERPHSTKPLTLRSWANVVNVGVP